MSEAKSVERAYGCVFCVTGKELAVVRHIERACDDVRAAVIHQVKLKTSHGEAHTEETTLYPGYVFFDAPAHEAMVQRLPNDENIISVLESVPGEWRLCGDDAKLVKWLFSYHGLLPMSTAYREGDWIQVVSGPLLDLQNKIVHFDKHHKSAQVEVTFHNRVIKTWLQFELIGKP